MDIDVCKYFKLTNMISIHDNIYICNYPQQFIIRVNTNLIYYTVIGKIKPKLYFPVGLCYVSTGSF